MVGNLGTFALPKFARGVALQGRETYPRQEGISVYVPLPTATDSSSCKTLISKIQPRWYPTASKRQIHGLLPQSNAGYRLASNCELDGPTSRGLYNRQ